MPVDEISSFLHDIKDDYMYPAIVTDLLTGLRRGEVLGLKWKDIDFKNESILVRRQLIRKRNGPELVERAKTDAGYRELEMSPKLIALLKEHKRQQLEIKKQLFGEQSEKVIKLARKKDPQDEDLVFCWPDGRCFNPDHLYRHLQRLLTKHGYDKLSVHGLRHSLCYCCSFTRNRSCSTFKKSWSCRRRNNHYLFTLRP